MSRDNVYNLHRRVVRATAFSCDAWRERAAREPEWAERQIGALLDRAITAELEVERLHDVFAEALEFARAVGKVAPGLAITSSAEVRSAVDRLVGAVLRHERASGVRDADD